MEASEGPSRHRTFLRPATIVALLIAAYVAYVGYHTVLNHYALGTAAYDLGIHENVLWNSIHGRWFESALERPGNHLGVHTTFILVLLFPIYALFPAAETLLISQTLLIGLAAWPLYLLARPVVGGWIAVGISALYLSHPAVGSANFYDFHALAFTPLLYFAACWAWRAKRFRLFWPLIVLLLSVREDQALLVVLLGVVVVVSKDRKRGAILVAAGVVTYVALVHGLLASFGQSHDFTSYYSDLVEPGEGVGGLVKHVLLHPWSTLGHALSPPKLLYLFQMFGPLAFLCFAVLRGWILLGYGLPMALLASREPLFQIGFQYPLMILPPAFVGAILALERLRGVWRTRLLTVAVLAAMVVCFRYGMIFPRHNFMGGFRQVDFEYSEMERERYRELLEMIDRVPPTASVTASEILVPHLAGRERIETIRYAANRPGRFYDYFLVLRDLPVDRFELLPEIAGLQTYELVHRGKYCDLLRRRYPPPD